MGRSGSVDGGSLVTYRVSVKTGEVRGSGTSGQVFLTFLTDNGSHELELKNKSAFAKAFQRNQVDYFELQVGQMSKILMVKLRLVKDCIYIKIIKQTLRLYFN